MAGMETPIRSAIAAIGVPRDPPLANKSTAASRMSDRCERRPLVRSPDSGGELLLLAGALEREEFRAFGVGTFCMIGGYSFHEAIRFSGHLDILLNIHKAEAVRIAAALGTPQVARPLQICDQEPA